MNKNTVYANYIFEKGARMLDSNKRTKYEEG